MIWTGRIRGCRVTAGHAWEQIKFTAPDAGEFYQTASVTEEAFLLFSLSVWFLLFLLLRKKKQEKWDKENPNANESSKTISFSETPPFSFSFTMKRRLKKSSTWSLFTPHATVDFMFFTIPPSFSFGKCHLPLHKGGLQVRAFTKKHIF